MEFYSNLKFYLVYTALIGCYLFYLSEAITPQNRQIGDLEYDSQVSVSHDGSFDIKTQDNLASAEDKETKTDANTGENVTEQAKVDCKLPCDDFDAQCDCKAVSVKQVAKDKVKETINNWIEKNGAQASENRIIDMKSKHTNIDLREKMNKEKKNDSISRKNNNSVNSVHSITVTDKNRVGEKTESTTTTTISTASNTNSTISDSGVTTTTVAPTTGVDTNLVLIGGIGGGIILILGIFAYQKYRSSNSQQGQQPMNIDPATGMPMTAGPPGGMPGMPMTAGPPGAGPGMPMVGNPGMQRNSGYGVY